MGLIRILTVDEHRAEMYVAAARITFALDKAGEAKKILQFPSPDDCRVPKNILEQARALAKTRMIECRERAAIKAKQPRLF